MSDHEMLTGKIYQAFSLSHTAPFDWNHAFDSSKSTNSVLLRDKIDTILIRFVSKLIEQ
jgi:hypothetical protein